MPKEKMRILLVDDDKSLVDTMAGFIREFDDYEVWKTTSSEEALSMVRSMDFSVVLTDIIMPGMNGLELLEKVHEVDPTISVIMITGSPDPLKMRKAIQLKAFDFLRKPFELSELEITIKQGVEKNQLLIQAEEYHDHLEKVVEQRTMELFEAKSKLEKSYLNTIYALINAMEANDIYTRGHSERVTIISLLLGKRLQLGLEELKQIHLGALLHDIGKVGIYDSVLNKSQSLTNDEFDIIKQHPIIGDRIIAPVGLAKPVHDIILQHHEWISGNGYPYGIKADEISIYARIVSIADAFDAMTSQRAYRQDKSLDSAFEEILAGSNIQFDAEFANIFYAYRSEILAEFQDKQTVAKLILGQL